MDTTVVILAAGEGKRMRSRPTKVLHKLAGLPMLERVINTAQCLDVSKIIVVYGNGSGEATRKAMNHLNVSWVEQQETLGTGHAVMQALPGIPNDHRVLVLYGDVPLISAQTLSQLLQETPEHSVGMVTANFDDPAGFGRVVRDGKDRITAVVEHKDATEAQKAIQEINTGIMLAPAIQLKQWLPALCNNNAQNEYYLTDVIAAAASEKGGVTHVSAQCPEEVSGVNDLKQLAGLERYYQKTRAQELMLQGVAIADPNRFDVRGELRIGQNVRIDINVIFEGYVVLGDGCQIGPNVVLKNVVLGKRVTVDTNSMIDGATIASDCQIGPFARIRPGTVMDERAKVGNFVELKKTCLGQDSKANHLSYLGDTVVGQRVNIGAGTITCNYDGVNKHGTVIKDGAFIGSNTALIGPVQIGQNATIGAGSVINENTPDDKLTLGRVRQQTVEGWMRPVKKLETVESE